MFLSGFLTVAGFRLSQNGHSPLTSGVAAKIKAENIPEPAEIWANGHKNCKINNPLLISCNFQPVRLWMHSTPILTRRNGWWCQPQWCGLFFPAPRSSSQAFPDQTLLSPGFLEGGLGDGRGMFYHSRIRGCRRFVKKSKKQGKTDQQIPKSEKLSKDLLSNL